MRLLEVNGISLLGASHQEAVNSLRTSGDVIHLLICEGYDAVEVERLLSEGKLIREPKSTSESVSSLDRVDFDEPNHFKVTYRRLIIKLFTFNTFSTVVQGDEAQEDGSCDHAEPEIARVTGSLPTSPLLGDRDSKTSDKVLCTTTSNSNCSLSKYRIIYFFRFWMLSEQLKCSFPTWYPNRQALIEST